MRIAVWNLAGLLVLTAEPAAAQPARAQVQLRCEAVAPGPTIDCHVVLRWLGGKPLDGAKVSLSASMPSMPMAHAVRPASAVPTGAPGEYRGRLVLEMAGAWAVQADIAGPLRDRAVHTLRFDDCAHTTPGCPRAAAFSPAAPAKHKH